MNTIVKKLSFLLSLSLAAASINAFAASMSFTQRKIAEPEQQMPTVNPEIQFAQELNSALSTGTVEDALALFDTMPEQTEELLTVKSALLLSAGHDKEAASLAKDLLAQNPKDLDILQLNVMIAKKTGDSAKKTALLKQILAIDPNNAGANIELGDEQALKHRYTTARNYFQKALSSEPENVEALFGYGKMSYYLEKDETARKTFQKILTVNPNDASALAYLGKLEGENKRYRKALDYIDRAIAIDSTSTTYYLDQGTYRRFLGDYAGAEQSWKQAVDNDPEYFLAYAYLAGLYDEQERIDDALATYRKVVEKNPQYYYAYEAIGMFAWQRGNWAEARTAFEKALVKKPDSTSYALMVAACYWKEKNIPQLTKHTEALLKKLDRNNIEYWVVRMFHDRGGDADVINRINREKIATTRNKMLFYAAVFYELQGNTSLAQKYYVEVANLQGAMFFEHRLAQWKAQLEVNAK